MSSAPAEIFKSPVEDLAGLCITNPVSRNSGSPSVWSRLIPDEIPVDPNLCMHVNGNHLAFPPANFVWMSFHDVLRTLNWQCEYAD